MNIKKQFMKRYGKDVSKMFFTLYLEGSYSNFFFDNLVFFTQTGKKNRKQAVTKAFFATRKVDVCKHMLERFETQADFLDYIKDNSNELGYYLDEKGRFYEGTYIKEENLVA